MADNKAVKPVETASADEGRRRGRPSRSLLSVAKGILLDNWKWRERITKLAFFELRKQSRGAVLSWLWLFIKPAVYIFCFWFALEIGLRASTYGSTGNAPYILWLCSGIIPWFFMRDILSIGIDVLHRYPYLVNKIKFPISAISTIYATATMIMQLLFMVVLFMIYCICGMPLDAYLLQVPVLLVLMFVFWTMVSIMFSQVTAMSKDVSNLMKTFSTPLFWLSGVIFNVHALEIPVVQAFLAVNPITFFVTAFRAALCDKVWIWDEPTYLIGFIATFTLTLVVMLVVYRRFNEEVADVL